MTDKKYKKITSLEIGYSDVEKTTVLSIIDWKDKLVAPDGDLVKPWSAINDKTPSDVTHHHRYHLIKVVTDGFNYEAIMVQQVEAADGTSRALRQGADNDPIEHLKVNTLKGGGGTEIITYESGRNYLSGLHIHVSNRKGTKYQPCTMTFKCRGNRTVD